MKHLIILLLCAIGLTVTLCVASLDTAHPSNLIDLPEEIGQVASGDTLMVYHNRYGIRIGIYHVSDDKDCIPDKYLYIVR
jgi:hypothetical protein